jgi:hypothetical protein
MRFNDIVRIGIARDCCGMMGTPLPSLLASFGLNTLTQQIRNEGEFRAFWQEPPVKAAVTLFQTHGWGETDEDAVINFPLFYQENWEVKEFHLTPAAIQEVVTTGNGILISTACWSGKQKYADAFLQAGFEHYIAPEKTSDWNSTIQFLAAFFGYMMYEERDWGARKVEVADAVEMARRIDDFWDGASGFRYFGHSNVPAAG